MESCKCCGARFEAGTTTRIYCSIECRRDKGPCKALNCDRGAIAGGFCNRHWRQERKERLSLNHKLRPFVYYEGRCERCDEPWRSLAPLQRFCSSVCQRKAEKRRYKQQRAARSGWRPPAWRGA